MASPQLENGHLKISNQLFEHLMCHPFSARELRVIMAVIRKTYGFNKKTDRISLGQICQMTGIKGRNNVANVLAGLVKKNVITREKTNSISRLSLQKDYELWGVGCSHQREHFTERALPNESESALTRESRSALTRENHKRHKDKKTHTRENHIPYQAIIDLYNGILGEAGLPRVVKFTDTRRKLIRARWNESPKTCDLDWWDGFFRLVTRNPFWIGNGNRGWRADFDWLLKEGNFVKVIEWGQNQRA
jgi:phage replication O-like protein O